MNAEKSRMARVVDRVTGGGGTDAEAGAVGLPARVRRQLEEAGMAAKVFDSGSTPTSVLAAEQLGVEVGQIAKSIVVKAKNGRFALILAAGDRRLDSKKLKQLLGAKTRMATPEETFEVTGYRPGGVCPFDVGPEAHSEQYRTTELYIDQSLQRWPTIYPAAGNDASGVPTTYDELRRVVGARPCDVAEG